MTRKWFGVVLLLLGFGLVPVRTEQASPRKPILYVIATAHLDSQWNWTVQDTIRDFVPNTFFTNFKYFAQYPHYTFNYEGAIHYMWFKEYYPEAWADVQKYVANGRWRISGSWINAVDTNVPSPESLMRQALYGKRFFRQEFQKVANDVYLPDCFGFGFALPSIAVHSGLTAFSTQKLSPEWGPAIPPPFSIGRWKGPDGSEVLAELKPGSYSTRLTSDISQDPAWTTDMTPLGDGTSAGYRFVGTGDTGGAPTPESAEWLEKAATNPAARVEIRNTSADQLSRDLTPPQMAALPEYEGELVMKTHGVGCYTSQAAMKMFNRQNELLADSAERAASTAAWLAGAAYQGDRLRDAWTRVLWHQFHDDLTGTCIPQAYQFSWNDELSAANQFAGVLTSAAGGVSAMLDTEGAGVPLVVYNPIASARLEPVEATVEFPGEAPAALRVIDRTTGRDAPSQILERQGRRARMLFLAAAPPVGFAVFTVSGALEPGQRSAAPSHVSATAATLENARYTVRIDANGDIASITDKAAKQELLKAPIRLEMRDDPSPTKPAWQILYETVSAPVREYVAAPRVRIVENGPVRAAIEITRQAAGSTIVQRVSLTDGGDRVDVENIIDWKSPNTLLKASFQLAASNPVATYDLGLGTIARGNNLPNKYEVPAQKWADITDSSGAFGTAILNDSKYGWDKPADNILRLSLIHTPLPRAYPYQSSNDLGHHRFVYAIAGHRGDWRAGQVPARAAALNQRLTAFQTDAHPGAAGRRVSLLSLEGESEQIGVAAVKKAEDSDELVVRFQERYGKPATTRVTFAGRIIAAREINAAEEPVGSLAAGDGSLALTFKAYQPRTIAVRLMPAAIAAPARTAVPLDLPFNLDGVSGDADRTDGDFDGKGHTIPAELFPRRLELDGMPFTFGSGSPGAKNVLVPRGQVLALPAGSYDRVIVLASAIGGDVPTTIAGHALTIREWEGAIGQWDSRLVAPSALREPFVPAGGRGVPSTDEVRAGMVVPWDPNTFAVSAGDIARIRPGFVTRDEIAWIGTHRHAPGGNQPYIMSYVFAYAVDLPPGTRQLALPRDERLRILAATLVRGPRAVRPAMPLFAADLKER